MKHRLLALFFLCLSLPLFADDVRLTVEVGKTLHRIDEKIYGHFLENIYHSCNNGLWGDLVWNRSFETNSAGQWVVSGDGVIRQKSRNPEQIMLLGRDDLTDYVFTVEARKTGGQEGFLIPFRYRNDKEFQWVNLGGWQNESHGIERRLTSQQRQAVIGPRVPGKIEKDRWYEIELRCEGKKITVKLDGKILLENDDANNLDSGNVGVGTWTTEAEFRNYKIETLDGKKIAVETRRQTVMPRNWKTFGGAVATLVAEDPLNDNWALAMETTGPGGIEQDKFCFRKDETYIGSLWVLEKDANKLVVSVPGQTGDIVQKKIVTRNVTSRRNRQLARAGTGRTSQVVPLQTKTVGEKTWAEIPLRFTAVKDDFNATLKVGFEGPVATEIDQISLMPKSWRDDYDGMRPDLLKAMDGLKAPVIRWPGGCYASIYRWKDGIGPQENRRTERQEMWDDKDVNSFGTDEFMKLCNRLGSEPILVVNLASQNWYPANQDRSEFIQDVFDWIEYCNGPADSKWGKIRAKNGHPEPYNVKYWELDNETWAWTVEKYADAINEIAPLIRKKYPELKLLVCGSNGYGDHRDGFPWNKYLLDHCAENFEYLSIHHYENPDRFDGGARDYEAFIARHRDAIAGSKNPGIKIYCSEWNAQSTDWRTGLYCGGILNGFERVGDIFEIGGPALFLRHASARAWDNALINFDNERSFTAPNSVVMKLYREHYAPNLLGLTGDAMGTNCVATGSEAGDLIVLKCVNPTDREKTMTVKLDGFKTNSASMKLVKTEGLRDRNTLENPGKIQPADAEAVVDGDDVRFTLPAYSVGVVSVR